MKVEITVKWGAASKVVYTVYNDWSMIKLYEVLRKIQELIEFDK